MDMKFVFLFCLIGVSLGAEIQTEKDVKCTEEFKGCKLLDGGCFCGTEVACKNPFPYLNEHQCIKELKGELDKCLNKDPCLNGQCIQVKTDDGYRKWDCSCAGSGFFGKRCEIACPKLEKGQPIPELYSSDCIY